MSNPGRPEQKDPAPEARQPRSFSREFAVATELPFILVGCIVLAGGFGYLLDRWLKTAPFGMLILGAIGFVAGVREILRRLEPKRNGSGSANTPR